MMDKFLRNTLSLPVSQMTYFQGVEHWYDPAQSF